MTSTDPPFPPTWWKSATVYQIYPHSFFDSNGDGIGDLNGIYSKLDYLKELGVDVLWLCPIYRSPHVDMGYDVSDYFDIDPRYGTMEDWHRLARGVHDRGMKVLMDVVANHTSNEHPWFQQSRAAVDNPKRDWYIWRQPVIEDGTVVWPNNWRSILQGPAWEFDGQTGQCYLHLFTRQQPDLNWDNPAVRDAMAEVMQFWIAHGCDGFRLDAINAISKREGLPDAQVVDHTQIEQSAHEHWANGPHVHEYLRELYIKVFARHDVMIVGEAGFTYDPAVIGEYVLPHRNELNETFNFELMNVDSMPMVPLLGLPWEYTEVKEIMEKWQTFSRAQGFWNTLFLENHDVGRSVTRFGDDSPSWRAISAKMLAVLQVTQTGTLYLYQGQEIGMKNFPATWGIEEYKDVATKIHWDWIKGKRQAETGEENPYMEDILYELQITGRDHARLPMQWKATENVGFTTGVPWMRAYEDDAILGWNVADESNNPESVLSFWKQALRTRKQHEVLIYGNFELLLREDTNTLAYVRRLGNTTAWVVLNLSPHAADVSLTENGLGLPHGVDVDVDLHPQLVLSNYNSPRGPPGLMASTIRLQGYEARVYIK